MNVACGRMSQRIGLREELRHARQHEPAVVGITRGLVERAGVLVRPVHADRELAEQRRAERVQQRVHVADGVDLVLRRHLRPAAGRAEQRDAAGALLVAELQPPVRRRVRRDVPVDAQHLIVARPVLLGLEDVVVLIRAGRIGRRSAAGTDSAAPARSDRSGWPGSRCWGSTPARRWSRRSCPPAADRG